MWQLHWTNFYTNKKLCRFTKIVYSILWAWNQLCFSGKEWKDPKAGSCLRQTQPILGPTYPGPSHPGEAIVKSVLSGMEKPVYLLDITLLTQLRKDGHPSIYAGEGPKYNDCSHWCLPGAPDTWNELLYAALF